MIRAVLALFFFTSIISADTPAAVKELQVQLRKSLDAAEPGIAAIVVSTNPDYPPLDNAAKTRPGELGVYLPRGPRTDGIVPASRDKLDLSDPRNAADNAFGSGIVLDRDGRILTSYHLIENARKIYVRFADGQGSYADIHAADARSDLAVLRLTTLMRDRKPLPLATVRFFDTANDKANVYRGLFVAALAHPFASGFVDGKPAATTGIVSAIRRRAPVSSSEESRQSFLHQYSNLLQTDARISVGSGSGALLNLDGEAIGLLTATSAVAGSESSGGYAIPMDPIYRRIVDVLKEGREVEYGFLGVSPDRFVEGVGLGISRVSDNTPASDAGLRSFDVVQAVDGRPVKELEDLYLLIGGSLAGSKITLDVRRGTRALKLTPTLAKFSHSHPTIASVKPDSVFGLHVDYSSLIAQQPMPIGGRNTVRRGVIIRELEPDSPAAAKLQPFLGGKMMVITDVNGTPVSTPSEFYDAARGQKSVKLTIAVAADAFDSERTITLP